MARPFNRIEDVGAPPFAVFERWEIRSSIRMPSWFWHQSTYAGACNTVSLTFSSGNNRVDGYGHDAAGNVSQIGSTTYTYDAENRLIGAGSNAS